MTANQITKKLIEAGIPLAKVEINRDRVDVWAGSIANSKRIARKAAKALGWHTVSNNGAYAWTEASPLDMGDYNDSSSRWHY
jgi:hypothetical protein